MEDIVVLLVVLASIGYLIWHFKSKTIDQKKSVPEEITKHCSSSCDGCNQKGNCH